METPRKWPIGDVITAVTGLRFAADFEGSQRVQEYMAGRPLTEHDFIYYSEAIAQEIIRQHPGLDLFGEDDVPSLEFLDAWTARRAYEYGLYLELVPLPPDHPARTTPAPSLWGGRAPWET